MCCDDRLNPHWNPALHGPCPSQQLRPGLPRPPADARPGKDRGSQRNPDAAHHLIENFFAWLKQYRYIAIAKRACRTSSVLAEQR